MTANKHILKLAVGSALLSALPADVYAHGWSEYQMLDKTFVTNKAVSGLAVHPTPLVQMPKTFRDLTRSYSETNTQRTLPTLTTRVQ